MLAEGRCAHCEVAEQAGVPRATVEAVDRQVCECRNGFFAWLEKHEHEVGALESLRKLVPLYRAAATKDQPPRPNLWRPGDGLLEYWQTIDPARYPHTRQLVAGLVNWADNLKLRETRDDWVLGAALRTVQAWHHRESTASAEPAGFVRLSVSTDGFFLPEPPRFVLPFRDPERPVEYRAKFRKELDRFTRDASAYLNGLPEVAATRLQREPMRHVDWLGQVIVLDRPYGTIAATATRRGKKHQGDRVVDTSGVGKAVRRMAHLIGLQIWRAPNPAESSPTRRKRN